MRWPWQKPEKQEEVPALPESYTPQWERLTTSELWKREVTPLLETMRQEALWKMLRVDPANVAEIARLQGIAIAYHALLVRPQQAQAMEQHLAEEARKFEESENGPGGDRLTERYNPNRRRTRPANT